MYSQHHSTTVNVPDAKVFCKLLAKGKLQAQTTHYQASGERDTRGAAGEAEVGDPQETAALHSLHIRSLPTHLSQQLPVSSVFQCGFDLSSLTHGARLTCERPLPH